MGETNWPDNATFDADASGVASRNGWINDAPAHARREKGANVTPGGRIVSGMAGLLLLAWGSRHRGAGATLATATALGLFCRAATGHSLVKRAVQSSPYERQVAGSRGWHAATVTEYAVTIGRPRDELYRFWRDFTNLPAFMKHVRRIDVLSPQRSCWTVKAPMGRTVQWISYVTDDRENERIAWESEADADVPNAGRVEFRDAPGNRGTEVRAEIAYQPPYGHAGRLASRMLLPETPHNQMADDLRRLKQLMETGETTVAQSRPQ